jgi:hypothetical protein
VQSKSFCELAGVITVRSVRATRFEFEKRFWIICAIYFVGFFLSVFDHTPFTVALRHLIAPSIAPGSPDAERFARTASVPMAAGIGVLASLSGFIFLVVANWIFVYRLILREEGALRQSQGESYRAYCDTVPRFWPSLRQRVPTGNRRPQWGQALGGESFVWRNC